MNQQDDKFEEKVREIVRQQLASELFTTRKITDTPTDDLQTVNRKYVNLNGVTGSRPKSSILGQFYYDTTIDRPIWWNGSAWVKADGSAV